MNSIHLLEEAASSLSKTQRLLARDVNARALFAQLERIDKLLQRYFYKLQNRDENDKHDMQSFLGSRETYEQRMSEVNGMPHWVSNEKVLTQPSAIPIDQDSRLGQLVTRFDLTSFEIDLLLLSLLPQFESRYELLLRYLQDDSKATGVTVAFALGLLCQGVDDRLAQEACLSQQATLLFNGLITLKHKAGLFSTVHAEPALYRYLIGQDALPEYLECVHWLVVPEHLPDTHPAFTAQLARVCCNQSENSKGKGKREKGAGATLILLRGLPGSGRAVAVVAAAASMGRQALCLDLALLPEDDEVAREILTLTLREARLRSACLVLRGVAEFSGKYAALCASLSKRLAVHTEPVVCLIEPHTATVWLGNLPQVLLNLPVRSAKENEALLRSQLLSTERLDIQGLVRRFQMSPDTLRQTVQEADLYRRKRDPDACLSQADLHAAFRLRAQQNFGKLAQRIDPVRQFDDLIISDGLYQELQEILAAIRHREHVLEQGFARKIGYGFGISVLFHGDSGTGKTMVAEVLAGALGVDLIKIDLSTVVNQYIGETEKNLSRIFDLASADAGVLFFDEADALFGKRSETKNAQDRHANIEVSYLLQRLENYPGLVILASNHRSHLDSAFTRRLTFITHFTKPDTQLREQIWRRIWPKHIVLNQDIDFAALARQTDLTGANIRNIALLASWLAAEDQAPVSLAHIQQALRREQTKMGRIDL